MPKQKPEIVGDESGENDIVQKLYLKCEGCNSITEIVFVESATTIQLILPAR